MSDKKEWGIIDIPINSKSNDKLKTHEYIDALAQIILTTRTPMTISIQGDWGSGKTSFVKMVLEQVKVNTTKSKFAIVEFNTWEYSKFEMEDSLPVTLVCKIAEEILKATGVKENDYKKTLETLKKAALFTTEAVLSYAFNCDVKEIISETDHTPVDIVLNLKRDLEDKISKSDKKFVIFIDDLDRLPPLKALEVLETLQLFLHLKNCVFILAVDYEVVVLGYKQKMGSENYPDWKSKNFFDKIIQLPFTIPNPQGTDDYLDNLLKDINFPDNILDKGFVDLLIEIIDNSIQFNPRNLKRLINSFGLLQIIIDNKTKGKEIDETKGHNLYLCLFYLLCMQLEYPEMYNFYVQKYENKEDIDLYNDTLKKLADQNIENISDYNNRLEKEEKHRQLKQRVVDLAVYSYLELKKSNRKNDVQFNYLLKDFMSNYDDVFEGLDDGNERLEVLKEAINLSVTTSNTAHESSDQTEKIGKLVQRTLPTIDFTSEKGKKSLEDLKNPQISKKLFGISFSVLKDVEDIKDSKEEIRRAGRVETSTKNMIVRYYAKPIVLNNNRHYLLCSEWYKEYKPKYESWLKKQDLIRE